VNADLYKNIFADVLHKLFYIIRIIFQCILKILRFVRMICISDCH